VAPNDLSGDLIANLDPASSVSAARSDSPRQAEDKIRRKARAEPGNSENESADADNHNNDSNDSHGNSQEDDKKEAHKIDSLA
jgi:hypothetical protein